MKSALLLGLAVLASPHSVRAEDDCGWIGCPEAVTQSPEVSVAQIELPPAPPEPAPPAAPLAAPLASTATPLSIRMFADAQYVWSTRHNNPVDAVGEPIPHPAHRAWERNNGFAMSFLGIDAVYEAEAFSVTTNLRFGSSVVPFYAASTTSSDLDGLATAFQAYGTWKPSKQLAVDVGRFSTIYGAEVAESWKNLNYTRGALYYAFQPFWHTGARVAYQATPELKLTGMVVDGTNNSIDAGAEHPAIGVQAGYTRGTASLLVGYLDSLDPENDYFDRFVDVVATLGLGRLSLVFNADLLEDRRTSAVFASAPAGSQLTTDRRYGASAGAGFKLTDKLGLAGRAEVLVDVPAETRVYTETVTVDYRPLENVILRLDNRFESSNQEIFIDREAAPTRRFFQTVVGFVVTTN